MNNQNIMYTLSIDPGKYKCGLAIVDNHLSDDLKLIDGKTVLTTELIQSINSYSEIYPFSTIILGDGTSSSAVKNILQHHFNHLGILIAHEKSSTDEARVFYWKDHPPKGIWSWIPTTLQLPSEPYDHYAAFAIAKRVLRNKER